MNLFLRRLLWFLKPLRWLAAALPCLFGMTWLVRRVIVAHIYLLSPGEGWFLSFLYSLLLFPVGLLLSVTFDLISDRWSYAKKMVRR